MLRHPPTFQPMLNGLATMTDQQEVTVTADPVVPQHQRETSEPSASSTAPVTSAFIIFHVRASFLVFFAPSPPFFEPSQGGVLRRSHSSIVSKKTAPGTGGRRFPPESFDGRFLEPSAGVLSAANRRASLVRPRSPSYVCECPGATLAVILVVAAVVFGGAAPSSRVLGK